MRGTAKRAVLFGSSVLLLSMAGCAPLLLGAAAGAGGVIWVKGKTVERFPAPVRDVRGAVRAALDDLELVATVDEGDALSARLEAEFADGKHVWIDLEAASATETSVAVRVGIAGEQERSRAVLAAIRGHLGKQ